MEGRPSGAQGASILGIRVTPARRLAFFLGIDALLVALAVALAFAMRFDLAPPAGLLEELVLVALATSFATLAVLYALGVYRVSWSHFGLRDVGRIAEAVLLSTLAVAIVVDVAHRLDRLVGFPRSVPLIAAPVAFCMVAAFRLAKRILRTPGPEPRTAHGLPTLIVGAGRAGAQVLASIQESGQRAAYDVVGFLDDDPLTHKTVIRGVPVLGSIDAMAKHVAAHEVRVVILCVAGATSPFVRRVVALARDAGVTTIRIVPALSQLVDGRVSVQATREVSLEDLLGRALVEMGDEDVRALVRGKGVLVTGGAGTIGAELCRQVARLAPSALVVLDVDETRLHDVVEEIHAHHPKLAIREALVDVRDKRALAGAFSRERIDLVFHAAAYKHVPMMERWPTAALDVNVLGTRNVIDAAERAGCGRFVFISTDKAVEPSSVMGASKRLAEMAVFEGSGAMVRSAVRFGNVIGSRGSVIPTFERQLRDGGPLTVTHPEMERYFMMTSEAVSLVLEAAALGQGGDLFVLEMGERVRIVEVAREFIRLHGLEPDVDVPIVFTGLRAGEKLIEVLHYPDEHVEATTKEHIRRIRSSAGSGGKLVSEVERLVAARDDAAVRRFLDGAFPTLRRPAP